MGAHGTDQQKNSMFAYRRDEQRVEEYVSLVLQRKRGRDESDAIEQGERREFEHEVRELRRR